MTRDSSKSRLELERELEEVRQRLREAEEVLRAIEKGEVDAIMVTGSQGDQVALILTPAVNQTSLSDSLGARKNPQFVTRSVRLGEVDRIVRSNREQAHRQIQGINLGVSLRAKQLGEVVKAAAENDSTLLLEGETGTGKNVIARWIYEHSRRSSAAFVEMNCASLKGDLLANELFGHERGAFTSATENKPGLLDVVNGGTLFLDEIGDMDPGVQAQFLKVLEEKRFRRLGGVIEQKSEFRLICATNRNLSEEIKKGNFRKDLFYRIHVFPIEVPSLRERPEDIPVLAESIFKTLDASARSLDKNVLRLLRDYHWPGNIRELRNVLERALLISRGVPLRKEHFPGLELERHSFANEDSEMDRIQSTLERLNGNKSKAAELLGMSRVTLYRKLNNKKSRD